MAMNRKFFRNRLTLPPCEFDWNELPVTRPPTQTSPPVAIPLIQIDSTASSSNTVLAPGESSGPAPSAYLDVPIPSSKMDITTTPLPLHEGDVPPAHMPSPGEEVTLPSVPRSASPLQPPTSEPANTPPLSGSVNSEHSTQVLAQNSADHFGHGTDVPSPASNP
ncbi:hypothetical protein B0H13DRAFT_2324465 [Mycena leptocephala]|nr:hypothetical protein B0H13DRAFT_2324465 [Mycena leptocephala]